MSTDTLPAWSWIAFHGDDEMLHEYDPDTGAHMHAFSSIDLARVTKMLLIPHRPGLQQAVVDLQPGQEPIFFRRRQVEVNVNPEIPIAVANTGLYHSLGVRVVGQGQQGACYLRLYDDGSALLTTRREGQV